MTGYLIFVTMGTVAFGLVARLESRLERKARLVR